MHESDEKVVCLIFTGTSTKGSRSNQIALIPRVQCQDRFSDARPFHGTCQPVLRVLHLRIYCRLLYLYLQAL